MAKEVLLSVHQLVDYLLRRGSIDSRIFNLETMQEGTRIHLRYQSIQNGDYESEVPLECNIECDEFIFTLQGRADGIIHQKDYDVIDEIKSTNADLEEFYMEQGPWHLGQAVCYGYMYCKINNLSEIGVQLTYISQVNNEKLIKKFYYPFNKLEEEVLSLLKRYAKFYRVLVEYKQNRITSSMNLEFPFDEFRKGQREVAKYVYKVANDGGLFFFEAPTGTGKTMSTLFPAVKTFAEERNEKLFYLSAKTQAKLVAHDAMKLLIEKGLKAHSIVLSSKEQMCQCEAQKCNPDDCPFAKNYYEKINPLIQQVLVEQDCIDKEIILNYALNNEICPFEFQLDLSLYCDVIICDYNYLFDPVVYLKRFFENSKNPYFALIDEAHNLNERTKDMFTMAIDEDILLSMQKAYRHIKAPTLKRNLKKIIIYIENICENVTQNTIVEHDFENIFYDMLSGLFSTMQNFMKEKDDLVLDEFLEVFKMINRFIKIHEYLDENFVTYIDVENTRKLVIRCIDPSNLINDTLSKIRGAVMFSATLTPIEYYINTLGGDEQTPYLKLPSPFDQNNLCLMVRGDISTRYKDREYSYQEIADSIKAVTSAKVGNYLVFFSSYIYLQNVLHHFNVEDEQVLVQEQNMTVKEKEDFLSHFIENPNKTTIGFAVLGGIFSEGIDLVSSRLIGAIVVGVGLPMVSFERNLIKEYYDNKGLDGFDYSYTNPGKNKVMQAAGRVIRSKNDRGVVLLIDQRFLNYKYRDLFKLEWSHYKKVNNTQQISNNLKSFWNE